MVFYFSKIIIILTLENMCSNFDTQRITEKMNNVVITDRMWARMLSSTNQPSFLKPKDVHQIKKAEQSPTQLLEGSNCNGGSEEAKKVEKIPTQLIEGDKSKDNQKSRNLADSDSCIKK